MATNQNHDSAASSNHLLLIEMDLDGAPRGTEATEATDGPDAGVTSPMLVAAAVAAASTPGHDDDNPISERALELINAESTILAQFGLNLDASAPTLFPPGTEFWDIGVQSMMERAAEYDKLPTLAVATAQHAATIATEERRDLTIKVSDWCITEKGGFFAKRGEPSSAVRLALRGWNDLIATHRTIKVSPTDAADVKASKSEAIGGIHPNVNEWIEQVSVKRQLRTRKLHGKPQGYAILGTGYNRCDSQEVLELVRQAMGGGNDIKCDVQYDAASTRMRANVYSMRPVQVPGFPTAVGSVHAIGIQIETGDTGIDQTTGRAYAERAVCRNYTLMQAVLASFALKHTGEPERIVAEVRKLCANMPALIGEMSALWQGAALKCYTDEESGLGLSIPEALERMVRLALIPIGDLSQDDAIAALVEAHQEERNIPGAAGVLSAMTRASDTWRTKWGDHDTADELNQAASEALYQRNYVLASPEFMRTEIPELELS